MFLVTVNTIPSDIPRELAIRVTDHDPDYVRYEVIVADGQFAGSAEIYGDLEFAQKLASKLKGFPKSSDDRRDIKLGSANPRAAGGWVKIQCTCTDRAGHAMVSVELNNKDEQRPRSVSAYLKVEAPAIDAFVATLDQWDSRLGSSVTLPGAA